MNLQLYVRLVKLNLGDVFRLYYQGSIQPTSNSRKNQFSYWYFFRYRGNIIGLKNPGKNGLYIKVFVIEGKANISRKTRIFLLKMFVVWYMQLPLKPK